RPEQTLAEERDAAGGVGLHVLLVEDRLLAERGAPAAVRLGPAEADPARLTELALPLHAHVPVLLVGGAAAPADPGELADQVLGQPGLHLVAEGRFLGRIAKVHPYAPSSGRDGARLLPDRAVKKNERPRASPPGPPGGRGARRRVRRCRGRPGGTPSRR